MGDITLFVIDDNGNFIYKRVGSVEMTMLAVEYENERFTLQPPPNYSERWQWNGLEWEKIPEDGSQKYKETQ